MKTRHMVVMALALVLALGTLSQAEERTVRGEVVQIVNQQRTNNEGELVQIRIRTRQGEQLQLQLGEAGCLGEGLQIGDRVRARVMNADGAGEPARVRTMKVRRTGQSFTFRTKDGTLLGAGDRLRDRARDGSGGGQIRDRQRIHDPGTGGCTGSGAGRRGGGGRGGRR